MTGSRISQNLSNDPYHSDVSRTPSKRKSGGLSGVLRKLFGKDKKTAKRKQSSLPPISKPTSFKHLSGASSRLIGATVEERYAKAQSLPHGVTRHSALGSHAPSVHALEKQVESDVEKTLPKRVIQRRATLPKLIDSNEQWSYAQKRESILVDGQIVDPADIGFAVTSGASFLKRRSRSADAMYAAMKEIQPEVPSRQDRRRSDEIRYWRASVCPSPLKNDQSMDDEHDNAHEIRNEPHPCEIIAQPVSELPASLQTEPRDSKVSTNQPETRDTFDFGGFAHTMQKEENISIEERVVTVEIKLMDLEHAISKLQHATAGSSPRLQNTLTDSAAPSHREQSNSDAATNNSTSTQPTATSLITISDEPRTTYKRESSNVRSSAADVQSGQHDIQPAAARASFTGLTIDHLNSLVGLIRCEQAARHRLEDQVVELQRDLKTLRQQLLPVPSERIPFARQRGWSSNQRSDHFDDAETDDGYQDVYQTPTEIARGHFEGFATGREGAAF